MANSYDRIRLSTGAERGNEKARWKCSTINKAVFHLKRYHYAVTQADRREESRYNIESHFRTALYKWEGYLFGHRSRSM